MHSKDPNKDAAQFRKEIEAILGGAWSTRFPDTLDFTRFVFTQHAAFSFATFTQNANFGGTTFTQYADFSFATFTQNATFAIATFTQGADFGDTKFTRDATFAIATFTQDANFIAATFTQDANFIRATFTQEAYFGGATFTQDANFIRATFTQGAYFADAKFTRDANFFRATFAQNADFGSATFAQNADFGGATFAQNADFGAAKFSQNIRFVEAKFGGTADFGALTLPNDAEVLLQRVNEKAGGLKARFLNSLLDRFRFEDVNWYTEKGRLVLQDELNLRQRGPTHELVADAYRRLVNNFEKARQYELAEQCVIGEMEMRRQNLRNFLFGRKERASDFYGKHRWARWLGEYFSALYLYRLLSLYGSSYLRALLCLFLMVFLLFPGLFGSFGLLPTAYLRATTGRFADLQFRPPEILWSEAWQTKFAANERAIEFLYTYQGALLTSLEVATFQRERSFVSPGWGSKVTAIAEQLAVPGQLALLLLALRRRFRR